MFWSTANISRAAGEQRDRAAFTAIRASGRGQRVMGDRFLCPKRRIRNSERHRHSRAGPRLAPNAEYLPLRAWFIDCRASRLAPSGEDEALRAWRSDLRTRDSVADICSQGNVLIKLDCLDEAQITVAMTRLDSIWGQFFQVEH